MLLKEHCNFHREGQLNTLFPMQAGDNFKDLVLLQLDTMSLPALKIAAIER